MGAREDIADALDLVAGVSITPHYRQSLRPGDGFVRFAGMAAASNGFGFIATWEVWIAIPQERKAGELWLEAKLPALIAAFQSEAVVTDVNPAELGLDDHITSGVILTGARAADNI